MASVVVARAVAEQRQEALQKEEARKRQTLQELFDKLDESKNGTLSRDEVKNLLREISKEEKDPSEDELEFVMKMAGQKNEDEEINKEELETAILCWQCYQTSFADDRSMGSVLFKRYDTDLSGKLNRRQIKGLLAELNNGEEVSEDDVDWVLQKADVLKDGEISKIELNQAIAAWFQNQNTKARLAQPSTSSTKSKSSVCAIL
eukprot:gb/GFBE01038581.1/.p1 GENE.gb/GFBE01038581.1/~~gb/GFBE01038581.1/.p1  ORF type:complete len:204 (+),score=58.79 gb/GFBE01038581.1/:1-612(+)